MLKNIQESMQRLWCRGPQVNRQQEAEGAIRAGEGNRTSSWVTGKTIIVGSVISMAAYLTYLQVYRLPINQHGVYTFISPIGRAFFNLEVPALLLLIGAAAIMGSSAVTLQDQGNVRAGGGEVFLSRWCRTLTNITPIRMAAQGLVLSTVLQAMYLSSLALDQRLDQSYSARGLIGALLSTVWSWATPSTVVIGLFVALVARQGIQYWTHNQQAQQRIAALSQDDAPKGCPGGTTENVGCFEGGLAS